MSDDAHPADRFNVSETDVRDGDLVTVTGRLRLHLPDDLGPADLCVETGNDTQWITNPVVTFRRPLPTGEGAVIRCLIQGLDGEVIAERMPEAALVGTPPRPPWLVPGDERFYADDQIARVLHVYDQGKVAGRG